jgi:uncharacterized protein (TIGR02996 family)
MDHNGAFIQAIAEDPTCDTKRVVYADWLDEHDHPRAADYLRTELKLAGPLRQGADLSSVARFLYDDGERLLTSYLDLSILLRIGDCLSVPF